MLAERTIPPLVVVAFALGLANLCSGPDATLPSPSRIWRTRMS